ncbi:MAG TPA: D-hexose-6-phosphate mutarotase [Propionibacteriaceae bacterium]|nr:D-hexose-6-phosphate mutarotase [Propionibacteriaceae bacterium]
MTLDAPREVRTPRSVAEVYDYGAHVWSWRLDGQPVLWQSDSSMYERGKPLRGGVPICWPWFGPGRTGDMSPAHGLARISDWTLTDQRETPDGTQLTYELTSLQVPDALPGSDWTLTYDVRVGEDLELALTVTNTGSAPFSYELALHTYLAVGDVRQVSVSGLDGASYLDKVTGRRERQEGDVTVTAETDRVYDRGGDVVVNDPVLARRLHVSTEGAANTVVWNPWVAKAAAMPDFGDDEWPGMICIEGGNVLDEAVTVDPGTSRGLRYRLAVEAS